MVLYIEKIIADIKKAHPQDRAIRCALSFLIRSKKIQLAELGELPPGFLSSLGNLDPLPQARIDIFDKLALMASKTIPFESTVLFHALEYEDEDTSFACLDIIRLGGFDLTLKDSKGLSLRDVIHDKHISLFLGLKFYNLII